jgi:hypothetical protein
VAFPTAAFIFVSNRAAMVARSDEHVWLFKKQKKRAEP